MANGKLVEETVAKVSDYCQNRVVGLDGHLFHIGGSKDING